MSGPEEPSPVFGYLKQSLGHVRLATSMGSLTEVAAGPECLPTLKVPDGSSVA